MRRGRPAVCRHGHRPRRGRPAVRRHGHGGGWPARARAGGCAMPGTRRRFSLPVPVALAGRLPPGRAGAQNGASPLGGAHIPTFGMCDVTFDGTVD